MPKPKLSLARLKREVQRFADIKSNDDEPLLFGVTDGKAVGTHFELEFRKYLTERYSYKQGNAARGIDFPELGSTSRSRARSNPSHRAHSPAPSRRSTVSDTRCSYSCTTRRTTTRRRRAS